MDFNETVERDLEQAECELSQFGYSSVTVNGNTYPCIAGIYKDSAKGFQIGYNDTSTVAIQSLNNNTLNSMDKI